MSLSSNKDLLRQIIIDHYDEPNNKLLDGELYKFEHYLHHHNKSATCIDDIKVYINFDNDIIKDLKFYGVGCAISTASTDILCDVLKNKTIKQALEIIKNYRNMINNESYDEDLLNELVAFCEIYKQQNRIKCSLIGVDAIERVINESKK